MSFSHTRAVVTGGGNGLGRAFCQKLAEEGARIVVSDIDMPAAEDTAAMVRRSGGEAQVVRCDVRDVDEVAALEEAARGWFGDTDLLINNAGVAVAGPIGTVSIEDWRWVVDINLWGVIHGCHVFVPSMRSRGEGYVLNVASAAGLLNPPDMGPYNVTKAAVVGLSETLAAEAKNDGIHVTVLCPTFFQTGIMDNSRGPMDPKGAAVARKLMARSKIQAPEVATAGLDAVAAGRLYCVPMVDGRSLWRIKRAIPNRFGEVTSKLLQSRLLNNLRSR
ncbi:MAG: SDR family NAD(P)-dependent oxidoreductase [Myxococcota bacterium]